MPNVIALVKEDRVRRQVEQFLEELEFDDLRFATFRSEEEMQDLYFRDRAPAENPGSEERAPEGAANAEDSGFHDGPELKLFSEIHMLFFALDTISGKPGPWIDKLRANMRRFKHFPAEGQLRLVMLKYEEDGLSKVDMVHPFLDDLIYLPIDRLIFLQKVQILLALPKRTTPRWLFTQEVQQQIEISKIAKIERLSDVAIAVCNPVPLKRGVAAHLYIQLPGERQRLEVYAKVLRSEPHPTRHGQFLVYFTYFGLSREGLGQIRRALSKSPSYKSLLTEDREAVRFNPEKWSLKEEDKRQFGIAIIDSDEAAANALAQAMQKEMDRIRVVTENSFQVFFHRYLDAAATVTSSKTSPPKASDESDFYSSTISLTISSTNLSCLSVDPGPSSDDLFLGHPALAIFSSPDKWLGLMQEKASRLIMEEAVQLVNQGRELRKLLTMQDVQNQRRAVNFRIFKGGVDGMVTVELSPAPLTDIVAKATSEEKSQKLDTLLIETSFVPEDPAGWMGGIAERAVHKGLAKTQKDVKFVFVTENGGQFSPAWLNCIDLLGLLSKPVDMRQLLFLLSEHLPNENTLFKFDNLGWNQPGLPAHISKSVNLEALSEYGATLKVFHPMQPGTVVYLRKSIYENAPNNCLAARVYACEEHPSEKGAYLVYLTYFGINDAFLKYARTWIREHYANQKNQET
ncbi:MAG: hypothetical protein AB7P49_12865 [Bdellovibrionales bacterium]